MLRIPFEGVYGDVMIIVGAGQADILTKSLHPGAPAGAAIIPRTLGPVLSMKSRAAGFRLLAEPLFSRGPEDATLIMMNTFHLRLGAPFVQGEC